MSFTAPRTHWKKPSGEAALREIMKHVYARRQSPDERIQTTAREDARAGDLLSSPLTPRMLLALAQALAAGQSTEQRGSPRRYSTQDEANQ